MRPRARRATAAWPPRAVAVGAGVFFLAFGLWAMVAPQTFFDAVARFEPYNQHFAQDIGAFQIGLGAVLILSVIAASGGALPVGLVGVGIGSGHICFPTVGLDLGGSPETDIPFFAAVTLVLLVAGVTARRQ